jgi:hypothetical protein
MQCSTLTRIGSISRGIAAWKLVARRRHSGFADASSFLPKSVTRALIPLRISRSLTSHYDRELVWILPFFLGQLRSQSLELFNALVYRSTLLMQGRL